ncbi:MAG: extracellular solute-binding protein, partial [Ornithinimicrobium sp.]
MSKAGARTSEAAGYVLGVDLGTTFTAAAISRGGRTEIVPLGDHAPQIPSAVFLTDTGEYLIGDTAIRRGIAEPGRLAQEFKRRIGDDTNIILGTTPVSPQALTAQLLAWVINHVNAGQGAPPSTVVLTHPANWGPYRLELIAQAARMAGLTGVHLCSEPEAAATHFAATERVEVGATVAVYDLGGGTFDAAVLRKTSADGFTLLGSPEGIEHLGGLDFDAAVLHHVQDSIGPIDIDSGDPAAMAALARLARDCTAAKEGLSTDNDVTIPVAVEGRDGAVRLSRPEFEQSIRPSVEETIMALQRALDSAAAAPDNLAAVVLIGGSSRIPLITHLLTRHLGRPIALSAQPKHAVALGATLAAAKIDGADMEAALPGDALPPSALPGEESAGAPHVAGALSRRTPILVGAAVLAALAVLALVVSSLLPPSDSENSATPGADGEADPGEPITLTLGYFGTSRFSELVGEYEELHPDITVDLVRTDESGSSGQALREKLLSGSGAADIELLGTAWMTEMLQYPDRFADLSTAEVEGRWTQGTTAAATTPDGQLLGYATDFGPMAVCYRVDLFREAGLPVAPTAVANMLGNSWEDYFDEGRSFVANSKAAWYDSAGGVAEGMIEQRETAYEDTDGTVTVAPDEGLRELYDQLLTASVTDGLSAGLPRSGAEWSAA